MTVSWLGPFAPLAVDIVLCIGIGTILFFDLLLPPGDKKVLGWGSLGVLVACLTANFLFPGHGDTLGGAYTGSAFSVLLKQVFFIAGALCILVSLDYAQKKFPNRQGEYYLMLLCSILGMSMVTGANNLILVVVCFELMSIPLYVLAAFSRTDRHGIEGALKLYLVGAVSSVTMLYGLSLLFGVTGSADIAVIAQTLATDPPPGAVLAVSITLAGIGFKIGVFPFHMWIPDTYEGAPTPVVAFISVAPKTAGLAILCQLLLAGQGSLLSMSYALLVILAGVTIIAGNIMAINQSNIKRLLGYSGVAHMGFFLMALVAPPTGIQMLLFYVLAYLFSNLGAFFVVHAVKEGGGDDSLASFDGLVQRSGWLGMSMLLFLLSLAGIPFVVGFWAKLYVFIAAWAGGLYSLVILGAIFSVVGLFYYLRIARAMFMNPPIETSPVEADAATACAIFICLFFVVGMGVIPGVFVDVSANAAQEFFDMTALD
jgi:NADH-quinone oxidoreductase subunit N